MTHMLTIKDLETRTDGTYYVGPLEEAKAYIREDCTVSVVSRPQALWTVFIAPKGTEIPDWSNVDDYGNAATEEDAWRYALGGVFGPADDEFTAFPLTHNNAAAVRALVNHHFPEGQRLDVFYSVTGPNAVVVDDTNNLWHVQADGTIKVFRA